MPQWVTRARFLIGWACLLGLVTWLDQHNLFIYVPYGISVSLLLLGSAVPLAILWQGAYVRVQSAVMIVGLVWLCLLPTIRWNSEKALLLDAAHLHTGMNAAQVQAIMAIYPSVQHNDLEHDYDRVLVFCDTAGCGGTVVNVALRSGQVVDVVTDLD
jgi:hypothetical protein